VTLGRLGGLVLGVLMVLAGVLWTGQGLGWIGGSSMSGQGQWAIIGPLVAGLGIGLCWTVVQMIRRGPEQPGPPGRYGR
jgi:hypothetical protein